MAYTDEVVRLRLLRAIRGLGIYKASRHIASTARD